METWIQIIFLIGSLLTLTALIATDMLLLQTLFLIANLLFLAAGIFSNISVMILMNVCYIAANIYQIIRLYLERSVITIPEKFKIVYQKIFFHMHPNEFIKFAKLGTQHTLEAGQYLCKEGEETNYLRCIMQGDVAIEKKGKIMAYLSGQFFIGEMRYLAHKPISANVLVVNPITYLQWSFETLDKLKEKKRDTYLKISEILGIDLVSKVQKEALDTDTSNLV